MVRSIVALTLVGLFFGGCTSDPASTACRTVLNCKDDAAPICDPASLSCRACRGPGDDIGCANRNTKTAHCGATGRCVECLNNGDCPTNRPLCGSDNSCSGCQLPADCPSLVCNADHTCAPSSDVLYVDNQNGACQGTHSGAVNDPICSIQEAVDIAAAGNKSLISVAPSGSAYGAVSITSVAPAGLRLSSGSNASSSAKILSSGKPAITVASAAGTKVVLSGFDLEATGSDGLNCGGGADLTLISSRIHDSANGIVSGCPMTLDGLRIYKNQKGISFPGDTTYAINFNNMMVWNNSNSGISFKKSTGTIRFVTVYANGSSSAPNGTGVNCGDGPLAVENSIIHNNISAASTDNQTVGCTLMNIVTNDQKAPNGILKPVEFVASVGSEPSAFDLHLKDNSINADCCIDKVVQSGLVDHDIDGNRRPQGAGSDIGAGEVR